MVNCSIRGSESSAVPIDGIDLNRLFFKCEFLRRTNPTTTSCGAHIPLSLFQISDLEQPACGPWLELKLTPEPFYAQAYADFS